MKEVKKMMKQIYGREEEYSNNCAIDPLLYLIGTLYRESLQANKQLIIQRKHSKEGVVYG